LNQWKFGEINRQNFKMTNKAKNKLIQSEKLISIANPFRFSSPMVIESPVTQKSPSFETINNYYRILRNKSSLSQRLDYAQCFAVRLADLVLSMVEKGTFALTKGNRFRNNFFSACVKNIKRTSLYQEVNDDELIVIYVKQLIHVLRLCGLIENLDGIAHVNRVYSSEEDLFNKIFNAFWNDSDWADIFPSSPDAARELKRNRTILTDVMLRSDSGTKLEAIANEFFELTAFSTRNNLFMISFLDFYFFTWLKHFGLIMYTDNANNNSIYIKVTGNGRRLFKTLFASS